MSQYAKKLEPEQLGNQLAFSTGDACLYLGVTRPTFKKWQKRYGIKRYHGKDAKKRYIFKDDLDHLKAEREKPRSIDE